MVQAAQRMQSLASDPDPAFERLLEGRVRSAMAARAAAPPPSRVQAWWGQTWGALRGPLLRPVALAGVAAALITGGGVATVQAAENSLPDSPLYVVKTVTEQVALAVAPSEPARQTVLLNQVTQRTDDLLRAAATNKSEKVLDTAADRLEQRISAAVDYALKAEARGDTAPVAAAEQLLDSLEARLDALPPRESVQKAKQAVAEQKDKLKNPPKPAAKPAPAKPTGQATSAAASPTPRAATTPRPTQSAGGREIGRAHV